MLHLKFEMCEDGESTHIKQKKKIIEKTEGHPRIRAKKRNGGAQKTLEMKSIRQAIVWSMM